MINEFTREQFIAWGRKGGSTRSRAKTIACRVNAKKPRKAKKRTARKNK